MRPIAIAITLFLLPSVAFAASFAKQSLFLSQPSVTEGETVLIHAVVSNDEESAFAGTMQFSEGEAVIGTVPVSLDAGEASAVSVSWKPSAGSHPVTAELKKGTESVEKQSATFKVAAKPVPVPAAQNTPQAAAAVESSQKIQESIASLSPGAASATEPLFTLIDSGRSQLSDLVDGQIETAKVSLAPQEGSILGTSTVARAQNDPLGTFWFILWTIYLYVLTVLNFIIGSAGVFYPLLAVLVLFFLWKLFNRFRRPSY